MAQNFLACDRDQVLLLAPSLRDWLPEDHFAWFVLDAVAAMDLSAFYAAYRHDGHPRFLVFPPSSLPHCASQNGSCGNRAGYRRGVATVRAHVRHTTNRGGPSGGAVRHPNRDWKLVPGHIMRSGAGRPGN